MLTQHAAAGSEVEDGWEQAGRSEGSRSSRDRGRGSGAPQTLQHQDRPSNAWGQQGSTAAGQNEVYASKLEHLPLLLHGKFVHSNCLWKSDLCHTAYEIVLLCMASAKSYVQCRDVHLQALLRRLNPRAHKSRTSLSCSTKAVRHSLYVQNVTTDCCTCLHTHSMINLYNWSFWWCVQYAVINIQVGSMNTDVIVSCDP